MPADSLNNPTPEEMAAFDSSIETQGFARVFVPISFLVHPNDILHRNDRRYRIVAIREHHRAQEIIFEPILGPADITFPSSVEMDGQQFHAGYENHTDRISAEVEAMDWPEVIGE
jgi:hypothetical protein